MWLFRKKRRCDPYTFEYDFTVENEVKIESMLSKTHPFLFPCMPFNYVLIEAERELAFYLNQDPNKLLHVPVGGGVIEADHISLSNWKLKNLYDGTNKVYVTVQKE